MANQHLPLLNPLPPNVSFDLTSLWEAVDESLAYPEEVNAAWTRNDYRKRRIWRWLWECFAVCSASGGSLWSVLRILVQHFVVIVEWHVGALRKWKFLNRENSVVIQLRWFVSNFVILLSRCGALFVYCHIVVWKDIGLAPFCGVYLEPCQCGASKGQLWDTK